MSFKLHHFTRAGLLIVFILTFIGTAVTTAWLIVAWQRQNVAHRARHFEQQSLQDLKNHDEAPVGGSFTLVNQDGQTVTDQTYRGKLVLLTFGYTFCPDVCPSKLQDMALALDQLGGDAQQVQLLFISIDPQRDTPTQVKHYVELYHNHIEGLSGSVDQIAQVAHAFKIFYKRAEDVGEGQYMMDHSTTIFLLDQDGHFVTSFNDGVKPAQIAAAMKARLAR